MRHNYVHKDLNEIYSNYEGFRVNTIFLKKSMQDSKENQKL